MCEFGHSRYKANSAKCIALLLGSLGRYKKSDVGLLMSSQLCPATHSFLYKVYAFSEKFSKLPSLSFPNPFAAFSLTLLSIFAVVAQYEFPDHAMRTGLGTSSSAEERART